ncbi:MAG: GatB/YqeY domain-containing protein [Rhodospirillales bacterium]|jgi:uncharacterized protein YqeY
MLRSSLRDALKSSMKEKNTTAVSTIRLILAALKDRDIATRSHGNTDGVPNAEILTLLQSMVKQRHESAALYEQGGRKDLSDQELNEIEIIRRFLPNPLDEAATQTAIDKVLSDLGAQNLKDMGRIMAVLRQAYPGQMDFAKASAIVKQRLS